MRNTRAIQRPAEIQAAIEKWQNESAGDNEEVRARLRKNLVKAIQEELTPRQRELLLMHYSGNFSQKEIAAKLGLDKTTVSRTLSRARHRLERVLRYSL